MTTAQLLIRIERTRRRLYEAPANDKKTKLRLSRKLDILLNEYYRQKGKPI